MARKNETRKTKPGKKPIITVRSALNAGPQGMQAGLRDDLGIGKSLI